MNILDDSININEWNILDKKQEILSLAELELPKFNIETISTQLLGAYYRILS